LAFGDFEKTARPGPRIRLLSRRSRHQSNSSKPAKDFERL
jgi:hypothetical protein